MTIICYRDGIMAADSAQWIDNVCVGHTKKIIRASFGDLVACAGLTPDCYLFREWALDGFRAESKPGPSEDFGALVIKTDGGIWRYDHRMVCYQVHLPYAIEGMHGEFVLGALAQGATAVEAVALAIKNCAYAKGEIQVERL